MTKPDRAVYFETLMLGDHAKVSAIDAESGIEVSVFGPASAARHDLERLALRKLERALNALGEEGEDGRPTSSPTPSDGGRGAPARRGRVV
jgi:hypothetical protein